MRLTTILLAAAATLLTVAPVQSRAPEENPYDVMVTVMAQFMTHAKANSALSEDPFDEDLLSAAEDSARDLLATLDDSPPAPCWAEWWSNTRSAAFLATLMPDTIRAMDDDEFHALAITYEIFLDASTDAMEAMQCPALT